MCKAAVVFLTALLSLSGVSFGQSGILRIEGVVGRDGIPKPVTTFSLTELQSMPRTTVRVTARNGQERTYEGVLFSEILKRAGQPFGEELRGSLLVRYVLVTAHDGYRVIFALPELDPAFNESRAIVADRLNGQNLAVQDGPLRLIVPGEKREARWVRMVERIDIVSAPEPMR